MNRQPLKTITLCGSCSYKKDMETIGRVARMLIERGWKVSVPTFGQPLSRKELVNQHLHKIKNSDAIFVINPTRSHITGYIDSNTLIEMAFAYALNKPIFVLNHIGKQPCQEEAFTITYKVIGGDVSTMVDYFEGGY